MYCFEGIAGDNFKPVGGTGHAWGFSSDGTKILKLNKAGREECSVIEFFANKVMVGLMPALTSDISLLITETNTKTNQYRINGVAVDRKLGFVDFSKVNIIRVIADIERKKELGDGFDPVDAYRPTEVTGDELAEIVYYFKDQEQGESRCVDFLREYYLTVFIRNLLQEDDQHKGNVGFYWEEKEGQRVIRPFAIDFDLLFQSAIGANFNIVRMSQWGSPYGRHRITLRDIVNSPFIQDSKPGHNPAIQANSLRATSFTNNKGRYTWEDVRDLRYVASLTAYKCARQEAILQGLSQLLAFDVYEFERVMSEYKPQNLEHQRNILLGRDNRCDFPHIFAVEVARIQLRVYSVLRRAEEYAEDIEFEKKLTGVREQFKFKYSTYASTGIMAEKRKNLLRKFSLYRGSDVVGLLKREVTALENDLYLHLYENKMKVLTVELVERVASRCRTDELKELVDWWENLNEGYILKAKNSSWFSRLTKNYFFNRNVTTYVTLRDILTQRAMVLRAKGESINAMMQLLLLQDSVLDSHSERPLSFALRLQLEFIRLFYKSYDPIGEWNNYAEAKIGWEWFLFNSLIFTALVLVKDMVKGMTEFSPFLLQCIVRIPRRWAADQIRDLFSKDEISDDMSFEFLLWIFYASIYLVFIIAQAACKLVAYFGGKITSPFLSANTDQERVFNMLKAAGWNEKFAEIVGNLVWLFSLSASVFLIFACTKVLTAVSVASTAFLHIVSLYKVFSYLLHPAVQLAVSSIGVFSMVLQVATESLVKKEKEKPATPEKQNFQFFGNESMSPHLLSSRASLDRRSKEPRDPVINSYC